MTGDPGHQEGKRAEVTSGAAYGASKFYAQRTARPKGFMVEDEQWRRIRRRVGEIEATRASEWILAVASIAFGIAVSAGIAYLVLPKATNPGDLNAGVKPTLIAALFAGLVVGVVLSGEYFRERSKQAAEKTDLQDEMDTIRTAWEQAEHSQ